MLLEVVADCAALGRPIGAWATDHAPVRPKKACGLSRYLEYADVCTRKSSSG
jgi:hypothetical protein